MTDEEIKITQNYERAVRNLNSRAWDDNVMLPSEKIADLQHIENYNAMIHNRLAADVRMENLESGLCGYAQGMEIVISKEALENEPYLDNVDTIFHESKHVEQFQANYIPEVREQYSEEELSAINLPVPDPEEDYEGYYNSPAEKAARQAGQDGVKQVVNDRETILVADREQRIEMGTRNQILETYDYCVLGQEQFGHIQDLETESEFGIESETAEAIQDMECDQDSMGVENGTGDFGMEMGDDSGMDGPGIGDD